MSKRHKKTDLQNLPACAVEFIKLVIGKMRYRRKVQQDVQAELTTHFEDELKDGATDEEKEQKAQKLITELGDVKLLAVLLRRAKKRCRPLWRTIVARTFQAIGVLILCFILYVVWFLSGKPVITTNYVAELNRMVRPIANETLNAAPLYAKAVDLYERRWDDVAELRSETQLTPEQWELLKNDIRILLGKKYSEVTADQKKRIEKWMADNEEMFELIIAGSEKPYYWQDYGEAGDIEDMMDILMPDLSGFRRLAFALRWRVWLAVEDGRYEEALSNIKAFYRLGQHLRGDKTLIEQLVGIAIEALAVQTIRHIVDEYEIDSTVLANLQRGFEQIIADENFVVSLKAERLFMYDEIQRCFTADRIGKGHLYLPRFRQISDSAGTYLKGESFEYFIIDFLYVAPFFFRHPNKQETLKSVEELYDYCEQLCLKTAAQMHAESNAIDNKFEELLSGNIFLGTLTPAVRRIIEISNRLPTDVGATLTIIAILRYNDDTGHYPQNLNQLVTAGYLRQLPMDTFSDRPLVYRKTDDSFILYSLGENFKDDAGQVSRDNKGRPRRWADEGDAVFWPVPKPQVTQ